MRTRETHINIRTTPKEKAVFEHHAKKCGLSLSEYLRKLANGHEPKALPPLEYQKIYTLLTDIYVDWMSSGDKVSANYLLSVVKEMQAALGPEKRGGDRIGNHENLGD
jgi:hypothetical protein